MNLSERTSLTLLGDLKAGDDDAWRRMTEMYGPIIYWWLRRMGLRVEDTLDVAQDVFQAVFVSIDRFRRDKPNDRFRDWLYTIAKRRYFDFLRKTTGEPVPAGGTDANLHLHAVPDPRVDESSILQVNYETEVLRRAMASVEPDFEPRTWKAFYLTVAGNMSPDEVAAQLHMSMGAVYVARSRVLKRMRHVLDGLDLVDENGRHA